MDNATLYSLKWFYRAHEWDRDEQEFFRFTPRHKPYKQVFPLDGIQVDVSKSVIFFFFETFDDNKQTKETKQQKSTGKSSLITYV